MTSLTSPISQNLFPLDLLQLETWCQPTQIPSGGPQDPFQDITYPTKGWHLPQKHANYGSRILAKTLPTTVLGNLKKHPFPSRITQVNNQRGLFAQLDRLKKGQYALVMFSTDWCGACSQYRPTFQKLAKTYGGEFLMIEAYGVDGSEESWRSLGINAYPTVAFIDHEKGMTMVDRNHYRDPIKSHPDHKLPPPGKKGSLPWVALEKFSQADIKFLVSQRDFFSGILNQLKQGNENHQNKPLKFKLSDRQSGHSLTMVGKQDYFGGDYLGQFQYAIDTDSNPDNGRIYLIDTFEIPGGAFVGRHTRKFFYEKAGQAPRRIKTDSGKYQGMGHQTISRATQFLEDWLLHLRKA